MLTVDRADSIRRRAELTAYLSASVDDGKGLVCMSAASCRESVGAGKALIEGQLSHVGSSYSLYDDEQPIRILIVPKQVGGSLSHGKGRGDEHVTVGERCAQVETAKFGVRPHPRTAHMDGTALALKVLLGLPVRGVETLALDGEKVHAFDCFAMANATLCSRVGTDASGQGSTIMFEKCLDHLRHTIEILAPNVVVAQGWSLTGWSPSLATAKAIGVAKPAKNSCITLRTPRGPLAFVAAVHPARNWATPNMAAWNQVEHALQEARTRALA